MTKHSLYIRLQATRVTLDLAVQECGHWDYEHLCGEDYECCFAMRNATHEHRKTLRAYHAAQEAGAK